MSRNFLVACLAASSVFAADRGNASIQVNQVGYFPDLPKFAVQRLPGSDSSFSVVTEPGGAVVLSGFGSAKGYWAASDDSIRRFDFSALTTPGSYRLQIPGVGVSYPFRISRDAYTAVTKAAIKSYYFQRSSTALLAANAGVYARAAGHPDNAVKVHNSAATAERPANSVISSPKGWYDAGDYGKYVVNSGISTWTLLDLYTQAPGFFDTLNLNIPESNNAIPDLLDEALWNLDWLLTMQDLDGGVYHKLTTANFSGFVMPSADKATRYVVQKGTAATLDFAALMAQTSRVFRRFEAQRPGFADSCLNAALRAWDWARANPSIAYNQGALVSPTVSTGGYGDNSFTDERMWAAMELTLATRRDSFWIAVFPSKKISTTFKVPGWSLVSSLGLMSSVSSIDSLVGTVDTAGIRTKMLNLGGEATYRMESNPLRVPVEENDLNWGSTSVTGNVGLVALHAWNTFHDTTFRDAALAASDWILGRNPLSTSFVTGYGTVTPMNPHHRPSGADGIVDPIPGFVVGGPNPGQQDADACLAEGAEYMFTLPAISWLDHECSYASNEVAINWNAPLAAILGILQAGELQGWQSTDGVAPRSRIRSNAARISALASGNSLAISSLDGSDLLEVRVLSTNGRLLAQARPGASAWILASRPSGMLVVQARTSRGITSATVSGL